MKRFLTLMLLLFTFANCSSQTSITNILWSPGGFARSPEYNRIEFFEDGTFFLKISNPSRDSFGEVKGTYIIDGNKIITRITDEYNTRNISFYIVNGMEWTLYLDSSKSAIYRKCIENSNGIKYYDKKDLFDSGLKVLINGEFPAVTLEKEMIEINVNANMRLGPGLEFEKFENFILENTPEFITPYIPSGREVLLIARSENPVSINGESNYWYYVDVLIGTKEMGRTLGWIWGGLLD